MFNSPSSNNSDRQEPSSGKGQFAPPVITLPKGGGAIRGIDEKFTANPATGTGSLNVPIATSPGRLGFGPQLTLGYDSGAGNGPFGLGWGLSLPQISRKTDKGLPRYQDGHESDIFILSGVEDLTPVLAQNNGQWQSEVISPQIVDGVTYHIRRYRPRLEGLFARIERWTNTATGEIHWRSLSRDNITTLYGKDNNSRIFDPADSDPHHPTRIFQWLICESYDEQGNAIIYEYKPENSEGVDLSQVHERNRSQISRAANRYLKRVKYGNLRPRQPGEDLSQRRDWLFEVVFDYGEGHFMAELPTAEGRTFVTVFNQLPDMASWAMRQDPFSTYRAGFEVRTYRLCRRILMFHHFPEELNSIADYLVRSTEFTYVAGPVACYLTAVTQSGYAHENGNHFLQRSLPPVEFNYSQVPLQDGLQPEEAEALQIKEIDGDSLDNLPLGLDGGQYRFVDLDGEGLSGILCEQATAWYYKPNRGNGHFGPLETVAEKPSLAALNGSRQQLVDLAGDGQLDLALFSGSTPGFFERTPDRHWTPFRPFPSLPNIGWDDPNLRFVDLTGDGHADLLITEDHVFSWYPSLAEEGFGPRDQVRQAWDEESGPRQVFADGVQSIYLADMSGDGLTDLVRIRNGEVCYWPSLGYGHFGRKVSMDNAPWFDQPNLFDQRRIRLADVDGSGVTDILYLGRRQVEIYFNQAGNRWSRAQLLPHFPHLDNLAAVQVVDLLGNGTACLVWSSPLPGNAAHPIRYIDLMNGQKPHLLIGVNNNLGAETRVRYAPSTKFYLADQAAGNAWTTRLPFPVHVVERVETYDHISRNRFVTRYAYHHGYYDGVEREFRGFGLVEQWDTEEMATLAASGELSGTSNLDPASHVPPVLTRTWFHTGAFLDEPRISAQFEHEYYREGDLSEAVTGLTQPQLRAMLLDDTVPPETILLSVGRRIVYTLTSPEVRQAYRALKGSILRQEIYALDDTDASDRPYSVSERNYTIELLQPQTAYNKSAVFFTHARETIDFYYERKLGEVDGQKCADPRVSHTIILETDAFGSVLRSLAIGYRRRALPGVTLPEQQETHLILTVNRFANYPDEAAWYRIGLPVETRMYEIVKPPEPPIADTRVELFRFDAMAALASSLFPSEQTEPDAGKLWPYEKWDWRRHAVNAPAETRLRLIEHIRTYYRKNDLTGVLPPGQVESLALPFESYRLAFTPGLLASIYQRRRDGQAPQNLLPNPALLLEGKGGDQGGYVNLDSAWWIPSGRVFYEVNVNVANPAATAAQELAAARQHFFLPRRFVDPFDQSVTVDYAYDLLVVKAQDALGNVVTAQPDYRVLRPKQVTDPNGNRSEAAFDALGMVVGTAVMGKDVENLGDALAGFETDLTRPEIDDFYDAVDPHTPAPGLLRGATTRFIYDPNRFRRTRQMHPHDPSQWLPVYAAALARETHVNDPLPPEGLKIQISFSYSDGFGREIQKKIQAEPGPFSAGGPPVSPRWVGSGWTIFNNKGKPVRKYEPFFSRLTEKGHRFEFGVQVGVSPILFYDPLERVVATLHPTHTYEKVVFDPWQQVTWDVNDTLKLDPQADDDVGDFFKRLPEADYLPTWYDKMRASANAPDREAARRTEAHARTPAIAHFDALGRPFLTIADNGALGKYETRVQLDIEGNQRAVQDALGRTVMIYDYDMLGNRVHQRSTDAGARWTLTNVMGKPIRAWDDRNFQRRLTYDALLRPTGLYVSNNGAPEFLAEKTEYGESKPNGRDTNHRGRIWKIYDGAGLAVNAAYDFKGNLRRSSRQLLVDYRNQVNWALDPPPALENELFSSRTSYDALSRPIQLIAPHSDRAGTKINVIRPGYNEANLLERVDLWLEQSAEPTTLLNPTTATLPVVANIDYDAKGQRLEIEYGESGHKVITTYAYDPATFRLTHLLTRRPNHAQVDKRKLQDLAYTYDPVGNITHIADQAQPRVFFDNDCIEASNDYRYDALYRLIAAGGREHRGQEFQVDWADSPRMSNPIPYNCQELRRYVETYRYDAVGNILQMVHQLGSLNQPGQVIWNRRYQYRPDNNRLRCTSLPGEAALPEYSTAAAQYAQRYSYDEHGNMISLPHLAQMQWDFEDQLRRIDLGGGGKVYCIYDAGGQRTRKVIERQNGTTKEERIYLDDFEIYRQYNGSGQTLTLERETLHLMDNTRRIALVETRSQGSDPAPRRLVRFQYNNHLGSAVLELDAQAEVISYEEYYPYGSTSYQAMRGQTETPKRYRFTEKERDEETGLYYHGARYYAPWLGRWTSCDPIRSPNRMNLYDYVRGNPSRFFDPDGREDKEFFKVDDAKTDRERAVDAAGILWPVIPVARGLFATVTGQVPTDYLVPGIGTIAIVVDETPRAGYKAAETVDYVLKGEGKQAIRSGIDAAVHVQNVGFSLLPFLTEAGRRPTSRASAGGATTEPNRATSTPKDTPTEQKVAGKAGGPLERLMAERAAEAVHLLDKLKPLVERLNRQLFDAVINKDSAFLERYLTTKEGKTGRAQVLLDATNPEKANIGLARMFYGTALEAMLAEAIQKDPELAQKISYTANEPTYAGNKKPDFNITSGPLAGYFVDLTTEKDVGPHQSGRPYGERQTLHLTYNIDKLATPNK